MNEADPSSSAPAPDDDLRQITFGNHTATCRKPDESMVLAIDLRYQMSGKDSGTAAEFNALVAICRDALSSLVPSENDIDAIITELASRRITYREMLELLLGVEPNNRQERRHPPAPPATQAQRVPRRRGRRR